MTNSLAELNRRFALTEQLTFTQGPGGLTVATISSAQATAMISLNGGQVMRWQPINELPVLWLGDPTTFAPGRAIRGGAPVCWPWFGPHASEPRFPNHGFARTSSWAVTRTEILPDGAICMVFTLHPDDHTHAIWPYAYGLQSRMTVGRELQIELATENRGTAPFVISEALHTYFSISDIRNTAIHGLAKRMFVDKVDGGRRKIQEGAVMIDGEMDRVYLDATTDVTLDDIGHRRRIHIHQQNGHSMVVWNPGGKAKTLDGFGSGDSLGMVCVESGNVLDNAVTVAPGEKHTLATCYRVEPLR